MNKSNHPGVGNEYEVLLPTLLSLRFCFDEDIEDFDLDTNVPEFANLDDLVVKIQLKDGEMKKFALQLKHVDKGNLSRSDFENKEAKNFSLYKYCKGFKMIEKREEYYFILYTNKNFDPKRMKEVTEFQMSKNENCPGKKFFYLSTIPEAIYNFDVNDTTIDRNDFINFLNKFSLYTNQLNVSKTENEIKKFFEEKFNDTEKVNNYVTWFRNWQKRKFADTKINKDMIKCKLFDILLTPHLVQISSTDKDKESKLFHLIQKSLDNFDIIICGDISEEVIKNCQQYGNLQIDPKLFNYLLKKYKFLQEKDQLEKITEEDKELLEDKLLCYFSQKAAIIKFDSTSDKLFYEMIHLLAPKIKFILFGNGIDNKRIGNFQICKNLLDLKMKNYLIFAEMTEKIQLSFQGGNPVSLSAVLEIFDDVVDVLKSLTMGEILQTGVKKIGNEIESLPDYISRSIRTMTVTTDSLQEIRNGAIIIDLCGNSALLNPIEEIVIFNKQYKLPASNQFSENTVYLLENFNGVFDNETSVDVHYFKAIDNNNLEWILTKGQITSLRKGNFDAHTIEESKIHERFTNHVNIICGTVGIGKSSLMESIRRQASHHFYTVKVDVVDHEKYFRQEPNFDNLIEHFLQPEPKNQLERNFLKGFLNVKKIMWFFDNIDRFDTNIFTNIVSSVELLASKGYRIWMSTRYDQKELLEDTFNVFSVEIDNIPQDNQKQYIKTRLRQSMFPEERIENIIEKLYRNAEKHHNDYILGIPLQLKTLIDEIVENPEDDDVFSLDKMYRNFFKAKFIHYDSITNFSYRENDFRVKMLWCQRFAVKSCPDLNVNDPIIDIIDNSHGHINIINEFIKFKKNGLVVFDHKTVMHYLIARYFVKSNQIPDLPERLENIRFLYDIITLHNK